MTPPSPSSSPDDQASALREAMASQAGSEEVPFDSLKPVTPPDSPHLEARPADRVIEPAPIVPLDPEESKNAEAAQELMQQIGRHLDQQSSRSERMVSLMERLPETLEALPEIQQRSEALVVSVNEHIQQQTGRDERLETVIELLSTSTGHQSDVITLLRQRIETDQEHDTKMVTTLSDFRSTLDGLGHTNEKSIELLGDLTRRGEARQDQLAEMVEKSHRTMLIVLGSTFFVAAAGFVLGLMALLRG